MSDRAQYCSFVWRFLWLTNWVSLRWQCSKFSIRFPELLSDSVEFLNIKDCGKWRHGRVQVTSLAGHWHLFSSVRQLETFIAALGTAVVPYADIKSVFSSIIKHYVDKYGRFWTCARKGSSGGDCIWGAKYMNALTLRFRWSRTFYTTPLPVIVTLWCSSLL